MTWRRVFCDVLGGDVPYCFRFDDVCYDGSHLPSNGCFLLFGFGLVIFVVHCPRPTSIAPARADPVLQRPLCDLYDANLQCICFWVSVVGGAL